MKKSLVLFALLVTIGLAGCVHSPQQYQESGRFRTGVLVSYKTDYSVTFTITGVVCRSDTLPPAKKNSDGTITPAFKTVELVSKESYYVTVTRTTQEYPYEESYVYVDKFRGDNFVEGKAYDFAMYAR
jgi:hypothetical protein